MTQETDRELLKLAAKAAGIEINWFKWERLTYQWNPLTDDGDALRLAVKLQITPWQNKRHEACIAEPGTKAGFSQKVAWADDPYAATRRAVVRAAAEIGRNIK